MGHPRRERCARIWCVRPVVGRHRTRSARLGRPPLTTTSSNGHALPPSPPPSPPPTPHSPRATSSNAVDASFAPSATETSHDATRARSSYATAASHRAAKTSVPSSRANAVNAAAATVSAFPPALKIFIVTNARYSFDTSRPSTCVRIAFAVVGVLAITSNPLTFLSNRCTGKSFPRSRRCAARYPSTVFFLYCPVGCTGIVAGLCTKHCRGGVERRQLELKGVEVGD
eukprot:31392-Pelagococcus_subviridis.AAC.2